MSNIKIKLHNVFHDKEDFSPTKVEQQMKKMILDDRVADVRIAKGSSNSPLFIILTDDTKTISIKDAKSIARRLLRELDREVSGVNIDSALKDRNLKIQN